MKFLRDDFGPRLASPLRTLTLAQADATWPKGPAIGSYRTAYRARHRSAPSKVQRSSGALPSRGQLTLLPDGPHFKWRRSGGQEGEGVSCTILHRGAQQIPWWIRCRTPRVDPLALRTSPASAGAMRCVMRPRD
eukprot:CAMPEP_0206046472 /NCGR_PEP_ID=MMETSP1466-20131121/18689_1 /ASSEMBLY_ACC=CAM_ASM_001126 /TAXON_ID=44452 /ORGANISM="Pavlova gyrans, Strain CCMP608" /LENGTH=133 /DNA_ID=CAMNT_0053421449 /DNA_START=642 /DNA_END=1043 /DNA_ORIENTATION=+